MNGEVPKKSWGGLLHFRGSGTFFHNLGIGEPFYLNLGVVGAILSHCYHKKEMR